MYSFLSASLSLPERHTNIFLQWTKEEWQKEGEKQVTWETD